MGAMHRRSLLGAGAAVVLAGALPGRAGAQSDGVEELIAGGGAIETDLGLVDFGLALHIDASGEILGSLSLTDFTIPGNPTVLESTQMTRLDPIDPERPRMRQAVGWVSIAGTSAIFVVQVEDAGGPGSGDDRFALYVGEAAGRFFDGEEAEICDCAEVSYTVEGLVVQGDIILTS